MVMTTNEGSDVLPDENIAAEFYARYDIRDKLGCGLSSTVRRCVDKETNKNYAVKIIDLTMERTDSSNTSSTMGTHEYQLEELRESTMKEIHILNICKGQPYIIQLHDTLFNSTYVFLVMELCRRGELFDYLTDIVRMNERRTRRVMRQLLETVQFLHALGIVHRDLKLENILLDDNFNVKVSDFGLASIISHDEELTDLCGTVYYMAPEILKAAIDEDAPGCGKPVDMWALGCVMFSLLTGTQPFWDTKQAVVLRAILACQYSLETDAWKDVSELAKDLVSKLLVTDPTKRLTATEALAHPFIHGYEEESLAVLLSPGNIYQEMIDYAPKSRFRTGALAVMAANRLKVPCQPPATDGALPIEHLRNDPYGFPSVRTLIDAGAFKIYHHWVKKNDNQSRAALFETSPRCDIKNAMMSTADQSSPR